MSHRGIRTAGAIAITLVVLTLFGCGGTEPTPPDPEPSPSPLSAAQQEFLTIVDDMEAALGSDLQLVLSDPGGLSSGWCLRYGLSTPAHAKERRASFTLHCNDMPRDYWTDQVKLGKQHEVKGLQALILLQSYSVPTGIVRREIESQEYLVVFTLSGWSKNDAEQMLLTLLTSAAERLNKL